MKRTSISFLLLFLFFASCGLTTSKARLALMRWSSDVRYLPPRTSGSSEIDASSVDDNSGEIVVEGIQESENSATADLRFDNFKYDANGRERSYSGKGTATFAKYNDGTWVLKKVTTPQNSWDNLDFKGN